MISFNMIIMSVRIWITIMMMIMIVDIELILKALSV